MIDFNRPAIVGNELKYIQDAVAQGMLCGDGKYTKLCSEWMNAIYCYCCREINDNVYIYITFV